jgi:TonB family protein
MPLRLLPLLAAALAAQTPVPLGPGINAPVAIRTVPAEYPAAARESGIEGSVHLEIVVDEKGRVASATVLRPLGFGLDEQARSAVSRWLFSPATKNGAPLSVRLFLETKFELLGQGSRKAVDPNQTRFAANLLALNDPATTPARREEAVAAIRQLAQRNFPPALYLAGQWLLNGENGPRDPAAALALIEKAAAKDLPAALYHVARARIDGRGLPPDPAKGFQQMHAAADRGLSGAQYFLAGRYERGQGLSPSPERARHYYRRCATQGVAQCQFRLGRLLLDLPTRTASESLQAIAFLELAGTQLPEAAALARTEGAGLTPDQRAWIDALMRELAPKQPPAPTRTNP